MDNIQINLVALIVAGIASMAVGFLWYSPVLFAKPWMKLMGYTSEGMKDMQKKMGPMYGLSFVATLVTVFVLIHSTTYAASYLSNMGKMAAYLMTAFWTWIGFVAPVQMTDVIFGSKKWKLFAINTGYQLVSLLVMAVILALM